MTIETPISSEVPKEVERKFLVKHLPDNLETFKNKEIRQGYVSVTEDGTETRVRQKGDRFYHTVKSSEGMVREEKEKEITMEEFDALWSQTGGRRVEKTRYEIPLEGGFIAELDIYHGDLEGLQTVEVEFKDEKQVLDFTPPVWFGEEVTGKSEYKNSSLALNGMPTNEAENIPEYNLEEGVNQLVEIIRSKIEEREGLVVVLVAGGSASGKTSAVADKVHQAFGDESVILSLDDYYRGRKFMEEATKQGINYNYDQPEVLNLDLFGEHLSTLKKGQTVEKPVYNFSIGEADKTEMVEPKKVIIVEGLFALNEKLVDLGDVKVFVEVDTHGRLIRRILRDIESRGQNPDDILSYFSKVVEPMHQEYIESTKKESDLIIKNEYDPEKEARGMKEVQLKFSGKISQDKLRKLGAERIGNSVQVDTYYNPKDRNLAETGEVLRIREENGHNVVSYKGPKQEGDFRIRPKIDFEIDQNTRNTFISMYGGAVTIIKKERTLYQLGGVTFSLDKVAKVGDGIEKDLGDFVEIRGISSSDENKLEQVIKSLGFNLIDGDKRAYSEM